MTVPKTDPNNSDLNSVLNQALISLSYLNVDFKPKITVPQFSVATNST